MKSFDSRSRSAASMTNKSGSIKQNSRHTSADLPQKSHSSFQRQHSKHEFFQLIFFFFMRRFHLGKGQIQANEDNALYKEIILRQHAVPLGDLLHTTES